MKKYTATIATGNIDLQGDRFSEGALADMAEKAKGLPVKLNFEHDIGKVIDSYMEDGGVVVEVEIDRNITGGWLYTVPSIILGEVEEVDGVMVIKSCELVMAAITPSPADPNLTPLYELRQDISKEER